MALPQLTPDVLFQNHVGSVQWKISTFAFQPRRVLKLFQSFGTHCSHRLQGFAE
jgi:hypothetical protein